MLESRQSFVPCSLDGLVDKTCPLFAQIAENARADNHCSHRAGVGANNQLQLFAFVAEPVELTVLEGFGIIVGRLVETSGVFRKRLLESRLVGDSAQSSGMDGFDLRRFDLGTLILVRLRCNRM